MGRPKSPDRPVRRPTQARSRATVEAIVGGTARVLAERGYHGTTTNHIAAAAGVSVGSLYQYFEDRDAAVTAVAEQLVADALDAARAATEAVVAGPPADAVGAWVDAILDFAIERGELIRCVFTEVPFTWQIPSVRKGMSAALDLMRAQALEQHALPPEAITEDRLFVLMTSLTAVILRTAEDPKRRTRRHEIGRELTRMLEAYLAVLAAATP